MLFISLVANTGFVPSIFNSFILCVYSFAPFLLLLFSSSFSSSPTGIRNNGSRQQCSRRRWKLQSEAKMDGHCEERKPTDSRPDWTDGWTTLKQPIRISTLFFFFLCCCISHVENVRIKEIRGIKKFKKKEKGEEKSRRIDNGSTRVQK